MKMEPDVAMALDALFVFLCGYMMAKFTVYFSTEYFPEVEKTAALDVASTAFVTAALLSLMAVFAGFEPGSSLLLPLIIIAISALLPAFGTFLAIYGINVWITSLIGFVIVVFGAFVPSAMAGGASLMGAIAGSIAAGYKYGTREIGFSIILGIVCGFLLAVLETTIIFFIFALLFSLLQGTGMFD